MLRDTDTDAIIINIITGCLVTKLISHRNRLNPISDDAKKFPLVILMNICEYESQSALSHLRPANKINMLPTVKIRAVLCILSILFKSIKDRAVKKLKMQ